MKALSNGTTTKIFKALEALKAVAETKKPVSSSAFCRENNVYLSLFVVLHELKFIETVTYVKRMPVINWIYPGELNYEFAATVHKAITIRALKHKQANNEAKKPAGLFEEIKPATEEPAENPAMALLLEMKEKIDFLYNQFKN